MKEVWRNIDGYKHYQVSNIGRVVARKHKTWIERNQSHGTIKEHFLKAEKDKDGYLKVRLHKHGNSRKFFVHRLVATAFIPNKENKPQVNHKDGIKDNNVVYNLEWVTASEQRKHAYDTGLQSACGEKNGKAKLTYKEIGEIRMLHSYGYKHQELADIYNISCSHVTNIVNYKYWNTVWDSIYDVLLILKLNEYK